MKMDEFLESLQPIPNPKEFEEELTKSEIYYFDENGDVTDKDSATTAILTEYDKDGNRVRETWGTIDNSASKRTK